MATCLLCLEDFSVRGLIAHYAWDHTSVLHAAQTARYGGIVTPKVTLAGVNSLTDAQAVAIIDSFGICLLAHLSAPAAAA